MKIIQYVGLNRRSEILVMFILRSLIQKNRRVRQEKRDKVYESMRTIETPKEKMHKWVP